jgi:hypothetical protein
MFIAVFARPLSGFLADAWAQAHHRHCHRHDCLALVGYAFAPGFGTP